jgi:hypothetical protein
MALSSLSLVSLFGLSRLPIRSQRSNMITGAQMAVATFCVSGVQIGQYARALCSCSLVSFSAVSRLPMRGQCSNIIIWAAGAVCTFCVSGV